MRVVTRNSVYSVRPEGNLFRVKRIASTWGQRVVDTHEHLAGFVTIGVGLSMETTVLSTSPVVAILPE